jgi:hypothetical protein
VSALTFTRTGFYDSELQQEITPEELLSSFPSSLQRLRVTVDAFGDDDGSSFTMECLETMVILPPHFTSRHADRNLSGNVFDEWGGHLHVFHVLHLPVLYSLTMMLCPPYEGGWYSDHVYSEEPEWDLPRQFRFIKQNEPLPQLQQFALFGTILFGDEYDTENEYSDTEDEDYDGLHPKDPFEEDRRKQEILAVAARHSFPDLDELILVDTSANQTLRIYGMYCYRAVRNRRPCYRLLQSST